MPWLSESEVLHSVRRTWFVRSLFGLVLEFVRHSETTYQLFVVVVRTDCGHLLPSDVNFHFFPLQRLVLVCEIILDPFIFQIKFIELSLGSQDSLVPHHDGVPLSIFMLEFANNREEADVCVPVEQA